MEVNRTVELSENIGEYTELTGYPSIDKPWLKYYSNPKSKVKLEGNTIYTNIYNNNQTNPDDIALVYFGRMISYRELFKQIEKVKNALVAHGIKCNDKVILYTSATPETIYTILALCRIGAVADMINPLFTDEQCIARINETGAELLIALDKLYGKIEAVIPKTSIKRTVIMPVNQSMPALPRLFAGIFKKPKRGDHVITWAEFINKQTTSPADAPYEKDRALVMVYSTGSTGASKGIVLTNDGINATTRHYINPDFPLMRGDKFLQIVPVWFSTGIVLSVLMPLCLSTTVILEPVFSGESFARDLKRYNPDITLNSVSGWLYVAKEFEHKKVDLSNMRYPFSGGEKTLPRVEKAMNIFFKEHGSDARFLTAYGMCELGSTITTDSYNHHKCGAAGYPMTDVIVSAFNMDTNKECKYGERGELRVYSPARMKGYFKNPKATEDFFWTDSVGRTWGCTGDIGYVDEDGFVYVCGRVKDHFIRENGDIIYLFDIEDKILEEETISQCKVIDIHESDKTQLIAHIVFNDNTENIDARLSAIYRHLSEALPNYMQPDYIKIRKSMPVSRNGKRNLRELREDREDLIVFGEIGKRS